MTDANNQSVLVLKRCRVNEAGYPFGLHAGDMLIGVNGVAWRGSAAALQKAVAAHGKPSLLTFLRGAAVFAILTERADLGLWDEVTAQRECPDVPKADSRMHNWEIMADMEGNHDLFPVAAPWLALVAPPVWLAQSRQWTGLAVFAAVIALCLPVGPALYIAVWLVAGLHLWRDGADHQRVALQLQGFTRRGIVAAKSEADAVALWCRLAPDAQFRFAQPRLLDQLQSEPG